jgi:hypothetical protein
MTGRKAGFWRSCTDEALPSWPYFTTRLQATIDWMNPNSQSATGPVPLTWTTALSSMQKG